MPGLGTERIQLVASGNLPRKNSHTYYKVLCAVVTRPPTRAKRETLSLATMDEQ